MRQASPRLTIYKPLKVFWNLGSLLTSMRRNPLTVNEYLSRSIRLAANERKISVWRPAISSMLIISSPFDTTCLTHFFQKVATFWKSFFWHYGICQANKKCTIHITETDFDRCNYCMHKQKAATLH
jgi:hypothetical protein